VLSSFTTLNKILTSQTTQIFDKNSNDIHIILKFKICYLPMKKVDKLLKLAFRDWSSFIKLYNNKQQQQNSYL